MPSVYHDDRFKNIADSIDTCIIHIWAVWCALSYEAKHEKRSQNCVIGCDWQLRNAWADNIYMRNIDSVLNEYRNTKHICHCATLVNFGDSKFADFRHAQKKSWRERCVYMWVNR